MRLETVAILVVVWMFGGCYHYVPIEVQAISAVTGAPMPGVSVMAEYPRVMEPFPPRMAVVVTGEAGKAIVPIAVDYKSGYAQLYFDGYCLDQGDPVPLVELPVQRYRQMLDDGKRTGAEVKPIPVSVRLLSPEEHSKKYPRPSR